MSTSPIRHTAPLGFPWKTQDPFLFCVYHADDYPEGNEKMGPAASLQGRNLGQDFALKDGWRMYHGRDVPGFPAHPHRGFETVTIVKKGLVDHSDSLGAKARFGHGDVQWLTSGKGLQHAEMFPLVHENKPNPLVLFQLWLNLPKASKFVEPHFKMLWADSIPTIDLTDDAGRKIAIDLIAGNIGDTQSPVPTPDSWAADPGHEVGIYTVELEAGAEWTLPVRSDAVNRTLYFYEGDALRVADSQLKSHQLVELNPAIETKIIAGETTVYLLILEGKPIGENVVQHGPFVMNSEAEIYQAMQDYQRTQFGGWPYASSAPVHPRETGRFAVHADGKKEAKPD